MRYNENMAKTIMVAVLLVAASAGAAQPVALSLSAVEKADAEVVTNVPLPVLSRRAGRFAFSLGCRATPTNNVEIAFGADADEDGVLAPRETRLVVGWDCGSWFVQRGFAGERTTAWSPSTDGTRTLDWNLALGLNAVPNRLAVCEGTAPLDFELPSTLPGWIFDTGWNLMRLTGRGLDV
ncbi:MAG: hypothetical protein MJ249_14560, partial [Kiritimatiellae bacterium]|nr:hypothetical protein [Kiritimatiellia bacterium]